MAPFCSNADGFEERLSSRDAASWLLVYTPASENNFKCLLLEAERTAFDLFSLMFLSLPWPFLFNAHDPQRIGTKDFR